MKNNLSGAIVVIARYTSCFLVLLIFCLSSAQAQQLLFYSCEVNNLYKGEGAQHEGNQKHR